MLQTKPSSFEIHVEAPNNANYFHSYTNENYLYHNIPGLQGYEDISDKVLDYIATSRPGLVGPNPSFFKYFVKNKKYRYVDEETVQWKHKLRSSFSIRSSENMHSEDACPGAGGNLIHFNTNVGTLKRGDVLYHYKFQHIQISVESYPNAAGTNFLYDCVPVGLPQGSYIPKEMFDANEKWVLGWSVYGEASRDAGSWASTTTGWIEYMTTLFTTAKEMEITDKAFAKVIRVRPMENPNNYPEKIAPLLDMKFRQEYDFSIEKMLTFGQNAGRTIKDPSSGHYRRYGDGLFSWIRDGNVEPYSIENADLDFFDQLFTSFWTDLVPFNSRDLVGWAGTGALKVWERINRNNFSKGNILATMEEFTKRTAGYDAKNYNGLQYPNAFFTKAAFFPAGSMALEHMPILDSRELSGGITYNGLPITSYYIIFADYGPGEGFGSNMELLMKRNAEIDAVVPGLLSPVGLINSSNNRGYAFGAHTGRSYKVVKGNTLGFRVNDPSKILMLVPDVYF